MIVRLYSGDDGRSHFEDMNIPAAEVETIALKAGGSMIIRRSPDGYDSGWHNATDRHFAIVLSGHVDLETSDGTVLSLGPGDMVLSEDTTGEGHVNRNVGGPRVTAYVPVTD